MIALFLLQAALPPAGPPQQPPATMVVEPVSMMIAAFDANQDGRVTRAECDIGLRATFANTDTKNAGFLGYFAFADWAETWLGDRNALPSPFTVDTNGDDRITLAELTTQIDRIFVRLDRDKDGALTRAELLTIRTNAGGERPTKRK